MRMTDSSTSQWQQRRRSGGINKLTWAYLSSPFIATRLASFFNRIKNTMAEGQADFGPAVFVFSQKANQALRTNSILHPNRCYRWLKKNSKPNGVVYYVVYV